MEKMPYIVVIIDEFASLMSTAGKDLDEKVARLTAMSRAVGIHLVFATQRPSVDVITGVIKNNLPTRVAFAVTSTQDSRTIIGATGAENLLGRGDLLLSENGKAVSRLQGVFLSDDEVGSIVEFAKTQGPTDYIDESYFDSYDEESSDESVDSSGVDDADSLWDAAIKILLERKSISASFLQRRLRIGYNRAARLVEEMEEQGIVGPPNGSKPRELIKYPDMIDNN
jgi:S-DNA-T family DNA segregation ATPase FtsK/SpoIIIE